LKKIPNPIDKHVGSRVRMRRVLIGMSQERLGSALGLTFQQVQKYEKGTNRIGASRLQQIAGVLSVPPAFFFEDVPGGDVQPGSGFAEDGSGFVVDFLSTSEGLLLNKSFVRIKEAKVRKKIIDLVAALAEEHTATAKAKPPVEEEEDDEDEDDDADE